MSDIRLRPASERKSNLEQIFYSPEKKLCIDFVDEKGLSYWCGKSLDDLKGEYGNVVVITYDEYQEIERKRWTQPPAEVTEEQFQNQLEVLPPENWKQIPGGEYFQMCEYWSCQETSYYARFNGKFYTFMNEAWKKPAEVLAILNG